jgi:hypothetical protein
MIGVGTLLLYETDLLLKDKGNQCHMPAGTPEGGQFCSSEGGGSSEESKPVPKEHADKVYQEKLNSALETLRGHAETAAISGGKVADQHLLAFKEARAQAQAEWKASQTGSKPEPIAPQKVFQADRNLYDRLREGVSPKTAYQQWRQDTSNEKAGKDVTPKAPEEAKPVVTAPPQDITGAGKPVAITPPTPPGTIPKGVNPDLYAQMHATMAQHLATMPKTAAIRETAKAHPEADMKHMLAVGAAHGLNASTVRIQTATARGNPWMPGPKTVPVPIGTNELNAGSFNKEGEGPGKFSQNNSKLQDLIEKEGNAHTSGQLKANNATRLAQTLAGNEAWQKMAAVGGTSTYTKDKSEGLAARIISNWASQSGDHDNLARAMQLAARDEFEMKDAKLSHMGIHSVADEEKIWRDAFVHVTGSYNDMHNKDSIATFKEAMRAYTRAEYEVTQAYFKEKGITEVSVFRGVQDGGGGKPKVASFQGQPLSSFSSNYNTARAFGSTIHMATFPITHVLGSTLTGRGCLSERELVILGHPIKTVQASGSHFPLGKQSVDDVGRAAFAPKMKKSHLIKMRSNNWDEDIENADWTKQSWDLPPYKSKQFMELLQVDLDHFRTLPVYKNAVARGAIKDDAWTGTEKGVTL